MFEIDGNFSYVCMGVFMKKIIFFKGCVETLAFFSQQLCDAFQNLGYETFMFDMNEPFDSFNALLNFCHKGEAVMITFNFIGLSGEDIFISGSRLFFDEYGIRCLNIVVDHPFYYHKNFRHLPADYIQFNIDRTHRSYMQRFFKHVKLGEYLPLAGTSADRVRNYGYTPIRERDTIDIMFVGNYTPPEHFNRLITRLNDDYTKFYHEIIDDLITHPDMTMDYAFEQHILQEIPDITDSDLVKCMENMTFIDLYVRFYIRKKAIEKLVDNGFKVDVYGNGFDQLACRHHENLIMHGSIRSSLCLKKLSRAKISLNVMPWFKDGAHDRIFNAAMNGACNLTDGSTYLHEIFDESDCVTFYDLSDMDKLPELAGHLLGNYDKLQKMADTAYNITAHSHTWAARAGILCKYI